MSEQLPRGFAPNAPIQSSDAQINVPVSVGGQIVHPGDIILGGIIED